MVEEIRPKGIFMEKVNLISDFPHYNAIFEDNCLKEHNCFDIYSMYASMFKANDIKRLYEEKHGFEYDRVIRSRLDVCPWFRLSISGLSSDQIYTANKYDDHVAVDDHIVVANSKNMDKIMDAYLFLDTMVEEFGIYLYGEMPIGFQMRMVHGFEPLKLCPPEDPILPLRSEDHIDFNQLTRDGTPPIKLEDIRDDWEVRPYTRRPEEFWKKRTRVLSASPFSDIERQRRYEWIIGNQVKSNAIIN
jgi:hypothetical protein